MIYPDGNDQMDQNSFLRRKDEFLPLTDADRKRAVRRKGYKNRIRPLPSKLLVLYKISSVVYEANFLNRPLRLNIPQSMDETYGR